MGSETNIEMGEHKYLADIVDKYTRCKSYSRKFHSDHVTLYFIFPDSSDLIEFLPNSLWNKIEHLLI